mgnify:CR=1 FL=1
MLKFLAIYACFPLEAVVTAMFQDFFMFFPFEMLKFPFEFVKILKSQVSFALRDLYRYLFTELAPIILPEVIEL